MILHLKTYCTAYRYHFYSRAVEAGFYGDYGRMCISFTKLATVSAFSTLMGDRLLDCVCDSTNAAFGGSGVMGDNIPSSSDPGVQGKVSLVVLHRIRPQFCCVQW